VSTRNTLFVLFILLGIPSVSQADSNTPGKTANPKISIILDGQLNQYSRDPENYALPGFPLSGEAGLSDEGFALGDNELILSGDIDNKFYGNVSIGMHQHEGDVEFDLEEAYIEAVALGNGFTAKAGRFFSGIGYLNEIHEHAWDFTDAPLIYRGLFGDHLRDEGVQLRWVAPTDQFIQLGLEVGRGDTFPAGGAANDGLGTAALFIKTGGDIGRSHSWQIGLSHWSADVEGRTGGDHDHGGATEIPTFTGDSHFSGIDFIWKWAPNGNSIRTNFKIQAEYFQRREQGNIEMVGSSPLETSTYDGKQGGWYLQGVYQFIPRWRVGLRYDRLSSRNNGSDVSVLDEAGLVSQGHKPERVSLMLDYSRSEFSRFRIQFNRDESRPTADNQLLLQYIMSIGSHSAHKF